MRVALLSPPHLVSTVRGWPAVLGLVGALALGATACNVDALLTTPETPGGPTGDSTGFARLVFSVLPQTVVAGRPITPAVEVTAQDEAGKTAATFTGEVTIRLETNPAGGTLTGVTTRRAVAGVTTFPDLSIDKPGSGYRLAAAAANVTSATSPTLAATSPSAASIALVSGNEQTDTAGATLGNPYVLRITDSTGAGLAGVTVVWTVTGGGGSITPTATSDGSGYARATRVLGTTAGLQTTAGTVDGLAGSPVTFTATATPGSPARLAFTVEPSTAAAGAPLTPAIEVTAHDGFGNTASGFAGVVTVALNANPGGGSLSGTTTRSAVAGVATFAGLSINKAGSGYQLRADASGLAATVSTTFNITGGSASAIQAVSGGGQSGTVASTLDEPYIVRVADALGNPVAGVTITWTVTEGGGTIAPAQGTTDERGEARASHTLGTSAGSQTVAAAAAGLTRSPVTFQSIAIPGPAARLVFTQQPSNTAAGAVIAPPVRVTVQDQFGNIATGFSGTITMSITPVTGTPGATLSGTRTRSVTAGAAVFDDLRINLTGLLYRLRATAGSLAEDSAPFDVLL
jgi:hypothetical protein